MSTSNPRPPCPRCQEPPRWQRDLPIDQAADTYVTRREFTRFLIMVSGAMVLGNGWFAMASHALQRERHEPMRIMAIDDIPVGGVKLFRYPTPKRPALLIRLAADRFVAYQQRCTHLSCPVLWAPERGRLECPCHNGAFDVATGRVLQGPPPRPLPRIDLRIADGQVWAEGVSPS